MINHSLSATPTHTKALSLLTSLFFIWGFITCLNDILIPHLKAVFTLSYTEAMLVQFCFFTAYFLISIPSGYLVSRIGYQRGMVTGLLIVALGCLLFYPAAALHLYFLFLLAFFVLASGITLLQVAANPYVTALGASESASRRLTLTQAFNSLGTTIAPYFGALLILSNPVKNQDELQQLSVDQLAMYHSQQASSVQNPYLALAFILLLLAVIFAYLPLPKISNQSSNNTQKPSSIWQFRQLVLGAIAIFVYVGGEVSIGSFLVSFLGEANIAGLNQQQAGQYVGFYWGGAMLGRFIGTKVMQLVSPACLLTMHAILAMVLVFLAVITQGLTAMIAILAVGLCNSIMFPTIFSLSIQGLGDYAAKGSGVLCSAIVGGALLPVLQGLLADYYGIQIALILPIVCYGYIAFYGWWWRVVFSKPAKQ